MTAEDGVEGVAMVQRHESGLSAVLLDVMMPRPTRPIHSTMTEMRVNGSAVELRIRVLSDDLSAAVALHAGAAVPADSSVALVALDAYVRSSVSLVDEHGTVRPLDRCGITRKREAYLLCYRSATAGQARSLVVRQTLLNERHRDQINVVRVEVYGRRRTLVLTRSAPSAPAWAP